MMEIKNKVLEHASDTQVRALKYIRDYYRDTFDPFPYRRYLKKKKCVFIHIPKTAGTSILHALGHSGPRDHATCKEFMKANPTRFHNYFKFCFVRNPESRFISLYNYFKGGGNHRSDALIANRIVKENVTASDFSQYVKEAQLYLANPMFWPQFMYVCDSNFQIMVDEVYRYESIDEAFQSLSGRLGLAATLPIKNRSPLSSNKENSLSSEASKIIRDIYRQDYNVFGYKMMIDK